MNFSTIASVLLVFAVPCISATSLRGVNGIDQRNHDDNSKSLVQDDETRQLLTEHENLLEMMQGIAEGMQENRELEGNREEQPDLVQVDDRHLQARRSGDILAKRVFVTSKTYRGNGFGGLSGADKECQTLAKNARLGGIYKAWLSDSTNSVSTRFYKSQGPYVLVDGTIIADNWSDLTDSAGLKAPIVLDETGKRYTGEHYAYTGTHYTGTVGWTCNSWQIGGYHGFATVGDLERTDSRWTWAGAYCGQSLHLLCFEQYPSTKAFK